VYIRYIRPSIIGVLLFSSDAAFAETSAPTLLDGGYRDVCNLQFAQPFETELFQKRKGYDTVLAREFPIITFTPWSWQSSTIEDK
jgi:hypothetical protein